MDTAPKSTFIYEHKIERHLQDYEIEPLLLQAMSQSLV